jgi:flagella basal body P-ring formation protein FlgA
VTTFSWKTVGWFTYLMLLTLAGEAAEVMLRPRTTVRSPLVRLGDIAEVSDDDPGIVKQLSNLPLFPAPAQGKVRNVDRQEVRQLLVMHEINLQAVRLAGAEEIAVSWMKPSEKPVVKTVAFEPASAIASPAAERQTEPIDAEPENTVQVAVAIRPLRMGQTLGPADIELRTVAGTLPAGQEPTKVDDLIGKELKRGLGAGQAIGVELLQSPRLVHRGDLVTIRSIAPGIVVTARGRATQEGGHGDLITIELAESREKILARVSDRQAVEVYAGSARYETQAAGK